MTRAYLREFGTARFPQWAVWTVGASGFTFKRLTVDDLVPVSEGGPFEPCNCPAYPSAWLHTWGIGRCYRPSYWCGRCGEPCSTREEPGRDHAPDYPAVIVVSDCCREPVFNEYRLQTGVTA